MSVRAVKRVGSVTFLVSDTGQDRQPPADICKGVATETSADVEGPAPGRCRTVEPPKPPYSVPLRYVFELNGRLNDRTSSRLLLTVNVSFPDSVHDPSPVPTPEQKLLRRTISPNN